MWRCTWRPEDNLECRLQECHQPSFEQGLFLTSRSPIMLDWLARKSRGSSCLYCSTAGIASAYHQAQLMQIDAGVNLRFSCLLGKHFPNRATSLPSSPYPTFPGSRPYTKKNLWGQKAVHEANFKILSQGRLGQGRECGQSGAAAGSHTDERYRSQEIGNLIITLKN